MSTSECVDGISTNMDFFFLLYIPCPGLRSCFFPLSLSHEVRVVMLSHEDKSKKQDPRLGHGMHNKKKKSISVEIPATHTEVDTSNNPSF